MLAIVPTTPTVAATGFTTFRAPLFGMDGDTTANRLVGSRRDPEKDHILRICGQSPKIGNGTTLYRATAFRLLKNLLATNFCPHCLLQ